MKIVCLFGVMPFLMGFVLLSGSNEAHLDANPDTPIIKFHWDGSAPDIKEKEKLKDGAWENYEDQAYMKELINLALETWNEVPGSYIQLVLETHEEVTQDSEDDRHTLVVKKEDNISITASARPNVESDLITDCDIVIAKRSIKAKVLAYALIHELGHCLGLGHNHLNYNALMGYSRSSTSLKLGADDMAGLIYLYPDPQVYNRSKKPNQCATLGLTKTQRRFGLLWYFMGLLPLILFCVRRKIS